MEKTDIVIVGVGGQGTLFTSKIIGEAALDAGLHVIASEIHGMAQRGGVVNTTVRIGEVHSPLIAYGDADIILSFEPIEALRTIDKASSAKTTIITNINPIYPFTVMLGEAEYPKLDDVFAILNNASANLIKVNMEGLALDNNIPYIASNIIMVGVLMGTGKMKIPKDTVIKKIKENVPARLTTENVKAFEIGYAYGEGHCD
jgi:indolepyruvate ferredoxin oxidoreductase beta subunit